MADTPHTEAGEVPLVLSNLGHADSVRYLRDIYERLVAAEARLDALETP